MNLKSKGIKKFLRTITICSCNKNSSQKLNTACTLKSKCVAYNSTHSYKHFVYSIKCISIGKLHMHILVAFLT